MKFFSAILIVLFFYNYSHSAQLNTICLKNAVTGEVIGQKSTEPNILASVTKVFTTHWGISRFGARYRYPTLVHVTPLGPNLFDVHLSGSKYPYFDKTFYQFLAGELNKIGIKNINSLTYDENFIYASDMRTNAVLAHGNYQLTANDIMQDLRRDTTTINSGLTALNAKVLALENISLPKTLTLTIKDIRPLSLNDYRPTAQTKTYKLNSSELYRNLKEMNRNSHNYAADLFFTRLSENQNYNDFIFRRINIPQAEINIQNGSGYPILPEVLKFYNQASCRAVLEVMADLKKQMVAQGLDFKDIVPVAGKDSAGDGNSSVTQLYSSAQTNGVLQAKTGTVANTVALAGLITTEQQNNFFHGSYTVVNTAADRNSARTKMKNWLISQIKDQTKTDLDNYRPKSFLAFDKESRLVPVDPESLR